MKMFALILYYSLPLLTLGRRSQVFDAYNQRPESAVWCKSIGDCHEGEHVICRFGIDAHTMGPRCGGAGGEPFYMSEGDNEYIVDLINSARKNLTNFNKNITDKDGAGLPKAYAMNKLHWNVTLADFAQVWANQCNPRLVSCPATAEFPHATKLAGIVRFTYPDWKIQATPNKILNDDEKRRFAVEKFVEKMYQDKLILTKDQIDRPSEEVRSNSYFIMINGYTTHVGCAMSVYIDYYREPHVQIFYVILVVCIFSSKPDKLKGVYKTGDANHPETSPCGCPPDYQEEECLCIMPYYQKGDKEKGDKEKGDKEKGDKEKGDKEKGDNEKGDKEKGDKEKGDKEKGDKEKGDKEKGDKEKGDKEKGDNEKGGEEKGDKGKGSDSKEKGDSSSDGDMKLMFIKTKKIKPDQAKDANSQGTCRAGSKNCKSPVVVMPIFTVEDADSARLQQYEIKTAAKSSGVSTNQDQTPALSSLEEQQIRKRIRDRVKTVKNRYLSDSDTTMTESETPFSDDALMDTTYPLPLIEPKSTLNENEEISRSTYATKMRSNIDIKSRKDFSNLEELVSEYLSYKNNQGASSLNYRPFNNIGLVARKSYTTSIGDDRNTNYNYASNVNNRQSTIRKLPYGVPGFDYTNAPYINNVKDERDQISTALYNLEQKSEDFAFNDNNNDNIRMRNTERGMSKKYNGRIRPTTMKGEMDYSKPVIDAYEENPNIAYYARTVQRRVTRPVTRYQSPLHSNRFDYYRDEPTNSRSILMNLANDESSPHTNVNEYSRFKTRANEDKNEFKSYLDKMKRIRPFKPLNNGFGDSREYRRHLRTNYGEEPADQHYYVPDRAYVRRTYVH